MVRLIEQLQRITDPDDLPDFIILDQNMPKRNGLQTLQFLKQNQRYAALPVMIYSTYIDEELIKKGASMGAAFVKPKPLTKDGYDKLVNDFIAAG